MNKPKVAVIGTGGTIASIGKNPLDIVDYGANKTMIGIEEILAMFPIVHDVAEIVAVPYQAIPSPSVGFAEWRDLVLKIDELAQDPSLDGIVVTHGTASLEETAYALHLTVRADLPVVVVGAQRPSSGLSTDAGFNIGSLNAARRAAGAVKFAVDRVLLKLSNGGSDASHRPSIRTARSSTSARAICVRTRPGPHDIPRVFGRGSGVTAPATVAPVFALWE